MAKYLQQRPGKVKKVMGEFKRGELKSGGSGNLVTDKAQAVAIALNEAGMSKKKGKKSNLPSRKDA